MSVLRLCWALPWLTNTCVICSAAERREERRLEERLLEAAREGDVATVSQLVRI